MIEKPLLESLRRRARSGDLAALQELRDRGFFSKATDARGYPLSHAQERLWLIEQISSSAAYSLPQALILHGDLDVGRLRRALDGLVARHESLRTTFAPAGQEPRQFVNAPCEVALAEIDLEGAPDAEARARAALVEDAAAPFDLARGPLLRASIVRLSARRHLLGLNVHHIAADAWSLGVIARDLGALYAGAPLEPLKTHYKDFAAWQRARDGDLGLAAEDRRRTLSGASAPLEIADLPRPAVQTFAGRTRSVVIDEESCAALERTGHQQGASLFMTLLALVNVLLFRHSGQRDIVVGTPVSGRDHPDLEPLVGMFVNTLALRNRLSPEQSFAEVLTQVRQTALDAYEHQEYPFDHLVSSLNLARDPGRSPLFDVMLSLEHEDEEALRVGPLRASPCDLDTGVAKCDLTFFFTRTRHGLVAALNYNTDLFREARIVAMGGHLQRLIACAIARPSTPIGRLEMLGAGEIADVVAEVERTRVRYDDRPLAALFEEQAALHPDAPAVGFGDDVVSYRELNARADTLAARLREIGVRAEECVGVLLDRSEWVPAAYLAVLKAGGAYVPLVPSYPSSRTQYMLQNAGCRVVISEARHIGGVLGDIAGIECIDVRGVSRRSGREGEWHVPPRDRETAGTLANVIYTSGSTGRPKGVLVEQRAVVRLARHAGLIQLQPGDRVLQGGSLGFDAATWEIWTPLLNGGAVYFAPEHELLEPGALRALLARHRITVMFLTTALFNQAADEDVELFGGLRLLVFGGERVSPPHVNRVRRTYPDLVILHAYGPTENTVYTTCQPVAGAYGRDVPIGRPIANTHVLLLDAQGELVPDGVVAEICAGGDGLARGYLGDPALTADRFVPHPFARGERLYRTGDLGRRLPDGGIEFVGRADAQIKLRGNRIEPGEIEQRLLDHPDILQAVVTLRGGGTQEPYLAAYVVADRADLDAAAIRDHLRLSLPDVMVPARIALVRALPLTVNGKIDYARLPDLSTPQASPAGDEPQGAIEVALAAIWRDLLGVERVGRDASFFELGGHSLTAVRLAARVAVDLEVRLPLQDVFRSPTIAALAERIGRLGPHGLTGIPLSAPAASYPVSHAQRRLWMLDRMGAPSEAYIIAGAFELRGSLDVPALARAVNALVERHESLRTTFEEIEGEPRQLIHAYDPRSRWLEIAADDAGAKVGPRSTRSSSHEAHEDHEGQIAQAAPQPFDLERGPLFRARLTPRGKAFIFTCEMAHIVSDGWSVDVVLDELLDFYRGFSDFHRGLTPAQPAQLRIQYKDYAAWQNGELAGPASATHREYWLRVLAGPLPVIDIPADRMRPAVQSFRGDVVRFRLMPATAGRLRELGTQVGASEFMTAVALVKALLFRYTRQEDLIVGSPVALRDHPDLQRQIGFYVNMLALRDGVSGGDTFADLLRRVRDTVTGALEHRVYPFDRLVEELGVPRDMGRNPVFDCVVTYEHASTRGARAATPRGVEVHPVETRVETSKFDLTFALAEDAIGGCDVAIEFSTDLFDLERMVRLGSHLVALAERVAAEPGCRLGAIDLLPERERAALVAFGAAPRAYPRDARIDEVFAQRVAEDPARLAVASGDVRLTYGELSARADAIARTLRERFDLQEEERVGVLLDRSEWVPAALLGILRAGGAYVPLDPALPQARLHHIAGNSGCRVVLSEAAHVRLLDGIGVSGVDVRAGDAGSAGSEPPSRSGASASLAEARHETHASGGGRTRPTFDAATGNAGSERTRPTSGRTRPTSGASPLAYVMYTSGSTGEPKGVLIEQRAVLRLVLDTNYVQLGPDDRVLQTGSLAFDASTFEIWGPLLNGGAVCFAPERSLLDAEQVRSLIARHVVTSMWLTSTLFNALVDEDARLFDGMTHLLVGGERLSPRHVEKARAACPGLRLVNGYGPTENTTFTACYEVEGPAIGDVPIGRPVANTEIAVLDEDGQLAPIGVPGEICAGGDGLARGYLGDAALTARAFVPHPWRPGGRIYRTGDVGRWRADGVLEYVGRRDRQVKLRGFRIEPAEIEHRLVSRLGIEQAVVTVHEDASGARSLVAYFTAREPLGTAPPDDRGLRAHLQATLPAYMVPAAFVRLDRFPLTPNGKLDYAALPAPGASARQEREEPRPRTAAESALLGVWEGTLGRAVGLRDNYFDLGGDSIRAIQIVGRLRAGGWALKVSDLFTHPSIEALAPLLTPAAGLRAHDETVGPVPPTPAQRWFFERHRDDLHHFNQSVLLRYRERVDEDSMRARLQRLQDDHAALRTTFPRASGGDEPGVMPVCHPAGRPVAFEVHDLRAATDPAAALEAIADRLQSSLDLASGPLMKTAIFQLPDADRLLIAIHHLVVDGVSWRILLDDLARDSPPLTTRDSRPAIQTDSYAAWAAAAAREAAHERTLAQIPYWKAVLEAPATALPTEITTHRGTRLRQGFGGQAEAQSSSNNWGRYGDSEWVTTRLDAEVTSFLLGPAHRAFGTEIDDLLLTALGLALNAWHGGEATRITLEGHGRDAVEDVEVSRTVGWFTAIFPFLLRVPAGDIETQVDAVRRALRRVPRNGGGYGMLRYPPRRVQTAVAPPALWRVSPKLAGPSRERRRKDPPYTPALQDPSYTPALSDPPSMEPEVSFNYLGQVDAGGASAPFDFATESAGRAISPRVERSHAIDVLAMVAGGSLELSIGYLPARHRRGTIETLAAAVARELAAIAEACRATLASIPWPVGEIEAVHRLSPMQEGLLFQSVYEAHPHTYIVQLTSRIHGDFDVDAFRESWHELCRRHASLRSAFVHEGVGGPRQIVLRDRPPEFTGSDPGTGRLEVEIEAARRRDLDRGFDLARDPLVRVAVLRLAADDHVIIWSHHHIVMDGWSLGVLNRELVEIYRAAIGGCRASLPPAPPYAAYVRWLESREPDAGRGYWQTYLEGYDSLATVPRDLPPSSARVSSSATVDFGPEMTARLVEAAAAMQVTLSTVIQGLWALLLSRYTGAEDVIFGAIVSGRPADVSGIEEMVGLFINAIPVRARVEPGRTLASLLQELQRASIAGEAFHHVPLAGMQQAGASGALFDHLVIFQNYPVAGVDTAGAKAPAAVEQLAIEDRTHYDLALVVIPGDSLTVKFSYNGAAFSAAWIARIGEHLRHAAGELCAHPARAAGAVDILPPEERDAVVRAFNPAPRAWPSERTVVDLVTARAREDPDAIALVCGDAVLTRGELDDRGTRIARYLAERHGAGPERPVGLLMDRSERLVAGILGILKAGAAYVPIDASAPHERRRYMLENSGAAIVLTDALYDEALDAVSDAAGFEPRARPDSLAYVIYTSGSTGRPKGCQIEHRQLAHYLDWCGRHYFHDALMGDSRAEGRADGRFALYSSLAFDLTVTSLFLPLVRGRALQVCEPDRDVAECLLAMFAPGSGVDSVKLTPSHIDLLRETTLDATGIALAIVGGEALGLDQARYLHALNPRMKIFNEYGPTETTVGCVVHEVRRDDDRVVIGRPIDNARIYILDASRNPVPVGVAGEIYVAGEGVGRGYTNAQALTAERFVPDPVGAGRAYRTGDIARWLPGGVVEYLGRDDGQVKIRGHRVELQEVEACLRLHPSVREAVVIARDGALVAYCTGAPESATKDTEEDSATKDTKDTETDSATKDTKGTKSDSATKDTKGTKSDSATKDTKVTKSDHATKGAVKPTPDTRHLKARLATGDNDALELRTYLRERLLEAMVPSRIVWLERLPLTANGKIDRAALSIATSQEAAERVMPRSPAERALAAIWEEVLQIAGVSIDDHFFELGGHSLKAMQVVARLQRRLGVTLPLRELFARPTIRELAPALAGADRTGASLIPMAPRQDAYELSHAQKRLWLLHHLNGEQAYNMPRAFVLDGLEPAAFEQAFARVIERHDALRTAFVMVDGEPRQRIVSHVALPLRWADTSADQDPEARARAIVDEEALRAFDLEQAPLLRATAIGVGPNRHVVLLVMHHIIGDGWSMNVLYREILSLYAASVRSDGDPLPPLRIQYADFAAWQNARDWADDERYWLAQLEGAPDGVRLPVDFAVSGERDFGGRTESIDLPPDVVASLRAIALAKRSTLSTLTLAVFSLVLHHFMKQPDLCIGLSVANRNHRDIENLIGFFVNVLPIRVHVSPDAEFGELLDQLTATVGEALEHQDYPFDLLVQTVNPDRASQRQPLVNVVFAYQSFEDVHVDIGAEVRLDEGSLAAARPFDVSFDRAKFDLTLFVAEAGPQLRLNLEYDSALFRPETVRRMLGAIAQFAAAVGAEVS